MQLDIQEPMEQQELKASLVRKASLALLGFKVQMVLPVLPDRKVSQVLQEPQVFKALPAQLELKAL